VLSDRPAVLAGQFGQQAGSISSTLWPAATV
jgi:hypothetical protein